MKFTCVIYDSDIWRWSWSWSSVWVSWAIVDLNVWLILDIFLIKLNRRCVVDVRWTIIIWCILIWLWYEFKMIKRVFNWPSLLPWFDWNWTSLNFSIVRPKSLMSDQNQTLANLYQFENFPERSYLTGYKIDYYTDFKRVHSHLCKSCSRQCWWRMLETVMLVTTSRC